MKWIITLLVAIILSGCGRDATRLLTEFPFVVGTIIIEDGKYHYIKKYDGVVHTNREMFSGNAAIITDYDLGVSVGDTLRLIQTPPRKEER